jgi:hypothetical protein
VVIRWREAQRGEADEIDFGPVTAASLQGELLNASDNPFWRSQNLRDKLHTKYDMFYI